MTKKKNDTGSKDTPSHIAIIMDGNGRWATSRSLPRAAGHKQGANIVQKIIESCLEIGIPYLTLYAFSSENWQRPAIEVENLMDLLNFYLKKEVSSLNKHGVRLNFIGDRTPLPKDTIKKLQNAEEITKDNNKLVLTIALSYGSRQEIINAIKNIALKIKDDKLKIEEITEKNFGQFLYTIDIPDPDLLIRTGGEQRLSNFLLWQSAYTEFFFTDILWPDFSQEDLKKAILEFSQRDRRYGNS